MTTDPGDLVLDPTCGSGTTAYVAEQWGRRWITMDTSRVALMLARTRLMAARFPYYLLADSPEGARKTLECGALPPLFNMAGPEGIEAPHISERDRKPLHADQSPPSGVIPKPFTKAAASRRTRKAACPEATGSRTGDIRKGFVYKRVPHVTLKAIANNEEIDAIHAQWQEKLEPIREAQQAQSRRSGRSGNCQPVPPNREKEWPKPTPVQAVEGMVEPSPERQQEIDATIARRAETEVLVRSALRGHQARPGYRAVYGRKPFSPPHHQCGGEERLAEVAMRPGLKIKTHRSGPVRRNDPGQPPHGRRAEHDQERAAEVSTRSSRTPASGFTARATYTDSDGKHKRVAVCIGPEHGTVGPDLVKEAAKEAVQGVGFDMLDRLRLRLRSRTSPRRQSATASWSSCRPG